MFTTNGRNLFVTLSKSCAYRYYGRCTYTQERARERERRETEKRTRAEDANGGDDGGDGSGVVE
jgi:hypothetical protein